MDGLLIDSEPFWQDAELEVFGDLGLPVTREACIELRGMRLDEVVGHWHGRYPWEGPTPAEVEARVRETMVASVRSRGVAMPGALEAIEEAKRRAGRIALASSSPSVLIRAVLATLGIEDVFEVVHSAEGEPYGKPHPAVYLSAARKLDVPPPACLALEDSLVGVLAAKSARMACVAVPEAPQLHDPRFSIADHILPSLHHLHEVDWDALGKARR